MTGVVVIDGAGSPVGMFTQREALEVRRHLTEMPVDLAMSARFITVAPHTALHYAAAQARSTRARHVLIVVDRSLTGIVAGLDFARAAAG